MKTRLITFAIIGAAFIAAYFLLFPEAKIDTAELARLTYVDIFLDINDEAVRDCKIDRERTHREIEKAFQNHNIRFGSRDSAEFSVNMRGLKLAFIPYCVVTVESSMLTYPPFAMRETRLEGRHLWLSRRMKILTPGSARDDIPELAGGHADSVASYMGKRGFRR